GRGMLIFCLAGIALLYGGVALAPAFAVLAPIYWAVGLAGHMWHPPAMGLLSETFRGRKGFAFGVHGTGANLGEALAPVVAGYLLLAMDWRQVILWNTLPLLAAACLLALGLPSFRPAGRGAADTSARAWLRQVRESLIQNPRLLAVCCISGVRTLAQHGILTFLPFLLVRDFGADSRWVGVALGIFLSASVLPEMLMGYLSDRFPRQRILLTGTAVGALALFLVPSWGGSPALPFLLVILGSLFISLRSVVFALGVEISPASLGGSAVGLIFMTNQMFVGVGSLLAGILADAYGPKAVFWFVGGLILLYLPIYVLVWRTAAPQAGGVSASPEAGSAAPAP
ncbi:MAG: MFS transporter, partial [Nitrospinota bacterium]